jgi:hypothetical protein
MLPSKVDRNHLLSKASRTKRLKGDGEAVGLKVDEVAVSIAGLAAGGDVGAAGLLDGDGDCWFESQFDVVSIEDRKRSLRMGTLRQFRPMRSSPLLQQAIFWPLPHTGLPDWESTLTSVFLSEAPLEGAARATAATEAMMRDLKKAILMIWWFWLVELESECGIGLID